MSALPDPEHLGSRAMFPMVRSGALSMLVKRDDGAEVNYAVKFELGTEVIMSYEPVFVASGLLGKPEPTGRCNIVLEIRNATDFHGEIKREEDE